MANARGTSFSAVSAPRASRNDAPSTDSPLIATVASVERSVTAAGASTPTHGSATATAAATVATFRRLIGCRPRGVGRELSSIGAERRTNRGSSHGSGVVRYEPQLSPV